MVVTLIGRSPVWRRCVRRAIAPMLLSVSLVVGVAGAKNLDRTKVKLVAIDEGVTLRISGWAMIPASAASARVQRFAVLFSLSGHGHTERFPARLNHGDCFALTHATNLIGVLTLRARVTDAGRPVGTAAVTTVTVARPPGTGLPTGGGAPGPPWKPSPTPEQPPTQKRLYVVPCSPPTLPVLGPGMGVVTGSFRLVGGEGPGVDVCTGATVTVTTLKGDIVGTAHVGSTESCAIAVPAGTYLVNAVATDAFVNGQPATLLKSREISVFVGGTTEIPVQIGIP